MKTAKQPARGDACTRKPLPSQLPGVPAKTLTHRPTVPHTLFGTRTHPHRDITTGTLDIHDKLNEGLASGHIRPLEMQYPELNVKILYRARLVAQIGFRSSCDILTRGC